MIARTPKPKNPRAAVTTKKTKRRASKRPIKERMSADYRRFAKIANRERVLAPRRGSKFIIAPGYHVVGFCDVGDKRRGRGDIVYFKNKDVLVGPTLPTSVQLRAYATRLGYYPSGKIGAEKDRCDPVYLYVERVPP